MRKTDVYLREFEKYKSVDITSDSKPKISENIQDKWQGIMNVVAEIMSVPAGLIMKVTKTDMEVFIKSSNLDNPYPENGKDRLGHGLYCETVIGTNQSLIIENALEDEKWKDNPDVALNMISYFGLPIKWSDGEIFGTICVLNNKSHQYTDKHQKLLKLLNEAIESDLYNLELIEHLERISKIDDLTEINNRRSILNNLESAFIDYHQRKIPLFCMLIDIDNFKRVNDSHGHEVGDDVLIAFSKVLKSSFRETDLIGRFGGDEFIVIFTNTTENEINKHVEMLYDRIQTHVLLKKHDISVSYGISEADTTTRDIKSMIKKADDCLLMKKKLSENPDLY